MIYSVLTKSVTMNALAFPTTNMLLTEIKPVIDPLKKQTIMEKFQGILEACEALKQLQQEPLQRAKSSTSVTTL